MRKNAFSKKTRFYSKLTAALCLSALYSTSVFATFDDGEISESSPSASGTEALLFNTQIQTTALKINGRISSSLNASLASAQDNFSQASGINAGDLFNVPYGLWGNYSYSDFDNDLSTTAFDGNTHGFLGGIDFLYSERTVLGVAFGYSNSDIDTTFNSGNQDTDSFTIAPYFGTILNDYLSFDFNIGYTKARHDQFRTAAGTRITSSPDSDQWFGSVNLNAIKYVDNWILSGRFGALHASSVIDSYTESNSTVVAETRTKVSTLSLAGDIAYSYGNYEPFVNLAYNYDVSLKKITTAAAPTPSNDKDDVLLTAGVRYFENSGLSGNLEYSKRLSRDDFDEDTISLTLRMDY